MVALDINSLDNLSTSIGYYLDIQLNRNIVIIKTKEEKDAELERKKRLEELKEAKKILIPTKQSIVYKYQPLCKKYKIKDYHYNDLKYQTHDGFDFEEKLRGMLISAGCSVNIMPPDSSSGEKKKSINKQIIEMEEEIRQIKRQQELEEEKLEAQKAQYQKEKAEHLRDEAKFKREVDDLKRPPAKRTEKSQFEKEKDGYVRQLQKEIQTMEGEFKKKRVLEILGQSR